MALTRLTVNHLRCIAHAELAPGTQLNFIVGNNGAGKTSLLEAIGILSNGRSFLNSKIKDVIASEQESLMVSGLVDFLDTNHRLGIKRSITDKLIRLDGESLKNNHRLSQLLPSLVFEPNTMPQLVSQAKQRRLLLDWLGYKIDPNFPSHASNYKRALAQRNAAIKSRSNSMIWEQSLADAGQGIAVNRLQNIKLLQEQIKNLIKQFNVSFDIELRYKQGWPKELSLLETLQQHRERDHKLGYTYAGPHRADIQVLYDGKLWSEFASRGQKKFTSLFLKLAQIKSLDSFAPNTGILLLDDLQSEFDTDNYHKIIDYLHSFPAQSFITSAVDANYQNNKASMFHVKHGEVNQVS